MNLRPYIIYFLDGTLSLIVIIAGVLYLTLSLMPVIDPRIEYKQSCSRVCYHSCTNRMDACYRTCYDKCVVSLQDFLPKN